jgi:Ca2+-binding EF-hand superfamily protein
MMKKLEVRVKQTEDQLGKKLQQLDKDRDGILDSNELREAVMKILKKKDLSAEETQNFIQLLDQDNDGKGMSAPPDVVSPYLTLSLSPR